MKYLIMFLAGCATIPAIVPPKPYASWPNQEWAKAAEAAVIREGLDKLAPADAKLFCANGLTVRNWVHFMAAVVHYESSFNPKSVYHESFGVDSSGLFQLTKKTDNPNYGCTFIDERDVQDPIKNIDCAAKIFKKLIARDGVVTNHTGTSWKASARYWSVLRTTGKLSSVKAKLKTWCE